MARPLFKQVYRDKDTNQNYEVATIWPSQQEGFPPNFSPVTQEKADEEAKFPTMAFSKALALVEENKGYINFRLPSKTARIVVVDEEEEF